MTERWSAGYVIDLSGDLDLAFSTVDENPAIRNVEQERAALTAGGRFTFRLRANTTKKIDTKTGADGIRRQGRRVPLRGDGERMCWLRRHADAAGFSFDPERLRITEIAPSGGGGETFVTLAGTLFEGILVVRDVEPFRLALAEGIGPAKAFGFGLLSIRRAP